MTDFFTDPFYTKRIKQMDNEIKFFEELKKEQDQLKQENQILKERLAIKDRAIKVLEEIVISRASPKHLCQN